MLNMHECACLKNLRQAYRIYAPSKQQNQFPQVASVIGISSTFGRAAIAELVHLLMYAHDTDRIPAREEEEGQWTMWVKLMYQQHSSNNHLDTSAPIWESSNTSDIYLEVFEVDWGEVSRLTQHALLAIAAATGGRKVAAAESFVLASACFLHISQLRAPFLQEYFSQQPTFSASGAMIRLALGQEVCGYLSRQHAIGPMLRCCCHYCCCCCCRQTFFCCCYSPKPRTNRGFNVTRSAMFMARLANTWKLEATCK